MWSQLFLKMHYWQPSTQINRKKANVIPIYKNDSKNLFKNYSQISLLPIRGKIVYDIIYTYTYFEDNNLLSPRQSSFHKQDSCVFFDSGSTHKYSLISVCWNKCCFLDIPNAFYRVWHEGLLFKFQSYSIQYPLINLITSLSNILGRLVLNGRRSNCEDVSRLHSSIFSSSFLHFY